MRVCLVIPPSPFLLSDQSVPWIGPLWVASCLRRSGHQVEVLDLTGRADYLTAAKSHACESSADCYGLTGTSQDYAASRAIASTIREKCSDVRLILGGAHATTSPEACLTDGWDAVVAGDGFEAAERALRQDGIVWASRRGEILEDIDGLPLPARDLIDLDRYDFRVLDERATSVMTSFGCPRGCTFCCGRDLYVYRRLRAFSPPRVLREWDSIRSDYPQFRALMDYADEWNIPPSRAIELAEAIAVHPIKWLLRCCVKAEYFTAEVARAMRRAGVVEVLCGIESGSDRILQVIRKGTSWQANEAARNTARQQGIRFKALTMVGLPTETRDDALQTKEWLLRCRPDDFDVTVYQPLRGSPIADRPNQEGAGLHFDASSCLPYKTAPGEYATQTCTDGLTSQEIVSLREEIDQDVRQELGLPTLSRPLESSMGQRVMATEL